MGVHILKKIGRPVINGRDVIIKLPEPLLMELDEMWPKTDCTSRSEFIRRAVWKAVRDFKFDVNH